MKSMWTPLCLWHLSSSARSARPFLLCESQPSCCCIFSTSASASTFLDRTFYELRRKLAVLCSLSLSSARGGPTRLLVSKKIKFLNPVQQPVLLVSSDLARERCSRRNFMRKCSTADSLTLQLWKAMLPRKRPLFHG